MPKFHEIYGTAKQPFKIRCLEEGNFGCTATCVGNRVEWDASGSLVSAVSAATYDWELVVEPTVESVLRERGYSIQPTFVGSPAEECVYVGGGGSLLLRIPKTHYPSRPIQAVTLCDFLDQYR